MKCILIIKTYFLAAAEIIKDMNIQRITCCPNDYNNGRQIYRVTLQVFCCESFNDTRTSAFDYLSTTCTQPFKLVFDYAFPRKAEISTIREIRFATPSSLTKFKIEVYVGIGEERR